MTRVPCRGILTAATLAACVGAQAQSNVYCLGIYATGTTYYNCGSFAFPFPPYHFKLSGRTWSIDSRGFIIMDLGRKSEPSDMLHQVLEVECGSESFTLPIGPDWHSILSVVMETGYPEVPMTLITVLDGSVGLYSTNGGRMIREAQNPKPNAAVRKLVAKAAELRSACTIVKEFPFPEKGHTRFYMISFCEVLTAEAEEEALRGGGHRMSPLFQAAQDLISQIRKAQAERKAESGRREDCPPGSHTT